MTTSAISFDLRKSLFDKACSQHDMVSGDFKDLARKSAADKVLRNKAVNLKHNGDRHGLVLMISKFFD